MVVARVAMHDIAADGALVADLGVGDQLRHIDQQRAVLLQDLRGDQLVLRGHGANADRVAVELDALELAETIDIDQMRRLGKAQLHHRQQTMTTGEDLCVLMCGQQLDRVIHARRRVIFEFAWNHLLLPVVFIRGERRRSRRSTCR